MKLDLPQLQYGRQEPGDAEIFGSDVVLDLAAGEPLVSPPDAFQPGLFFPAGELVLRGAEGAD